MKKLILVILFALPHPSLAISIADLSPVSHWTCDELSGVRYDSSSNNNDLTDNNTVLYQTGLLGNACDFERSNSEYLSITDSVQTGLDFSSSMSASMWIKTESDVPSYEYRVLMAKDDTSNRSYSWQLWDSETPVGTINQLFQMYNSGGTVNQFNYKWAPTTTVWYHIVMVYDATAQKTTFYNNGSVVGSETLTNSNIRDTTAKFTLGSYGTTAGYFDGLMDEITVFDRALTAGEVTQLYNGGVPLNYPLSDPPSSSSSTSSTTTVDMTDTNFMLAIVIFFLAFMVFTIIFSTIRTQKK